jgi:prephenate dehydratase
MLVCFNQDDGVYLDSVVGKYFFPSHSTPLLLNSKQDLLKQLLLNPELFGLVPIEYSGSGFDPEIIEGLCKKRYKIFGEVYLRINPRIFYTKDINPDEIQNYYIEKIVYDNLPGEIINKYKNKLIIVKNIYEILEANPYKVAIIAPENFNKNNNLKNFKSIDFINNCYLKIRYYVIGRAFYDLPPDEADKLILIVTFKENMVEEKIRQLISVDGMTLFQLIKTQNSENEYYLEIGFAGFLDLKQIEEVSINMNILGILESGEIINA